MLTLPSSQQLLPIYSFKHLCVPLVLNKTTHHRLQLAPRQWTDKKDNFSQVMFGYMFAHIQKENTFFLVAGFNRTFR